MSAKESLGQKVVIWTTLGCMIPGFILMASGAMQLISQAVIWMRQGEWHPLPAVLLFGPKQDWPVLRFVPDLYWGDGFTEWLTSPADWRGIAQFLLWFLNWFPSPLFCVVVGFVVLLLPLWIMQRLADEIALWRKTA